MLALPCRQGCSGPMLLPVTPSEPAVIPLLSPAEGWPFLEGAPQTPRSSRPSLQLLILWRVIIFQALACSGGQRRRLLTHREKQEMGPTERQDLPEQGGHIVTWLLSAILGLGLKGPTAQDQSFWDLTRTLNSQAFGFHRAGVSELEC